MSSGAVSSSKSSGLLDFDVSRKCQDKAAALPQALTDVTTQENAGAPFASFLLKTTPNVQGAPVAPVDIDTFPAEDAGPAQIAGPVEDARRPSDILSPQIGELLPATIQPFSAFEKHLATSFDSGSLFGHSTMMASTANAVVSQIASSESLQANVIPPAKTPAPQGGLASTSKLASNLFPFISDAANFGLGIGSHGEGDNLVVGRGSGRSNIGAVGEGDTQQNIAPKRQRLTTQKNAQTDATTASDVERENGETAPVQQGARSRERSQSSPLIFSLMAFARNNAIHVAIQNAEQSLKVFTRVGDMNKSDKDVLRRDIISMMSNHGVHIQAEQVDIATSTKAPNGRPRP